MHHQLMLQRYGLGIAFSMPAAVNCDPIFTPLFTALIGGATIGATGISFASVASAIAVTAFSKEIRYFDRN